MTEPVAHDAGTAGASTGRPLPDWAQPGAYGVGAGVWRIPLPMPNDGLVAVNVYAIEDGDRLALVDGGWAVPAARDALDRTLGQLDADPRAISRILVTHIHQDHYTLAVQLRREHGMPIALGAGERPSLLFLGTAHSDRFAGRHAVLQRAGARGLLERMNAELGPPQHDSSEWETPDEWLASGQVELSDRVLDVVRTPGHTQGHIVFRDEPGGLLFAGDHVLPHITPSIGFEPIPAPSPLRDYISSLELLRQVPDLTLLPAHGAHGGSVHERVDELVAHHAARLHEVLAVVESCGEPTAAEVAASVVWTRRRRPFGELDLFNQMLAVNETVAHLTVLVSDGRLVATGEEIPHYRVDPAR